MPTQKTTFSPHKQASSQLTAHWSQPSFTFSAKERDVETGLSYYGSRYYSSDLSIWLSVDPQAAKYPGLSPFTYCANNPVKLVDPNGEEIFINEQDFSVKSKILFNIEPPKDTKQSSTLSEKIEVFETKAYKIEEAFAQGLAATLPISSTVNDLMILKNDEDMFGNKATEADKTWSKISLATLGAGSVAKQIGKLGKVTFKTTGKVLDKIAAALDIRSGVNTTAKKIIGDNEKQKDN